MVLGLCVQEHARAKMKVLVLVLVLGAAGVAATAAPLGDDDDAPQALVIFSDCPGRCALSPWHLSLPPAFPPVCPHAIRPSTPTRDVAPTHASCASRSSSAPIVGPHPRHDIPILFV